MCCQRIDGQIRQRQYIKANPEGKQAMFQVTMNFFVALMHTTALNVRAIEVARFRGPGCEFLCTSYLPKYAISCIVALSEITRSARGAENWRA